MDVSKASQAAPVELADEVVLLFRDRAGSHLNLEQLFYRGMDTEGKFLKDLDLNAFQIEWIGTSGPVIAKNEHQNILLQLKVLKISTLILS